MDSIRSSMSEILETMDLQTEVSCLDSLTPAHFRELLSHLNITVSEEMLREKMKEALFLSAIYMDKFSSYQLGDVVVFFNDFQVINIVTKDKKVSLYELNCQYPCSVCHFNVDDDGERGQGLECSVCESWFHNSCTDFPIADDFYNSLTDSPNFIKICCPPCLKNGQVKKLQKQIAKLQTEFKEELTEVKQLINGTGSCDLNIRSEMCNTSSALESLRDEFRNVVQTEIEGLKNIIQAELGSMSVKIDSQRDSIVSVQTELCTINTELTNIKTSIRNVDCYFANNDVVNSIQQIKDTAEMAAGCMEAMDIKETAAEYKEVVDQLKEDTEELTLSINSSMSSVCQSTENAMERISIIDQIDINKLSTSLNTLDNVCRDQVTQASALAEAVKDVSQKVNEDIITENVVSQLAQKICEEMAHNKDPGQNNNLSTTFVKSFSSTAAQSSLETSPSTAMPSRRLQPSTSSAVTVSSLAPSSSLTSQAPSQKLMNESKTVSIGNVRDKNLIVSSAKIKSQFNKCFPRMEIVHCKKSMNGFILIELDTPENAKLVVENWEGHKFFNTTLDKDHPTAATLLQDVRAKAVIDDVDKDFTDEEMTENLQTQFPQAKARRFINKHGPTHCVLLSFKCKEDLERAKDSRAVICDIPFRIRPYETRKTLIQCYNCYGFRHIAAHCRKKKTCPYCTQCHAEGDCLIKKDKLIDQYKCTNCKGNHTAIDKNCDQYKLMLHNLSQNSNDQQK